MRAFNDPAFPGLAQALDPSWVLEMLQRSAWDPAGDRWDRCMIANVKGIPGRRWAFAYEVSSGDGATAPRRRLFGELVRESRATTSLGTIGGRIELHAFPNDPVLTWLPNLLEPETARSVLQMAGQRPRLIISVSSLQYAARERATLLYEGHDRSDQALVVKTTADKSAAKLFERANSIHSTVASHLKVARPVGYSTTHHLVMFEKVPGVPMATLIGSDGFAAAVEQLAEAIADLHAIPIPARSSNSTNKFIKVLDRSADLIEVARPSLGKHAHRLATAISTDINGPSSEVSLIHGDLHLANVLVDRTGVHVIDLDEIASGDPVVDVGRFLALIRSSALRRHGDLFALDDQRNLFLAAYQRHSGRELDRLRLKAVEVGSLIRNAAYQFTRHAPDWEAQLETVFDAAEILHGSRTRAA